MKNKVSLKNQSIKLIILACCMSFFSSSLFAQDLLRKGYPERYVVQKGDTLWDLSAKYLNEPWRWKELWKANTNIKNPELIYPGDTLILTLIDGKPSLRSLKRETVKLKPQVRETDFVDSIPPVSPKAMKPFIQSPLVTTAAEMQTSAYIFDGVSNRLVGGKGEKMYARGIKETTASQYQVYRQGRVFVHPMTGEKLGVEAIDIGRAKLIKPGDPAKVMITSTKGVGVVAGDFLRPVNDSESLPFFFPSVNSDESIKGFILPLQNRSRELGKLDVVAIAFDENADVQPGQVFKMMSKSVARKDPRNPKEVVIIPEERLGVLMIIRVFDRISYGIITDAEVPVNGGDSVVHPSY